MNLAIMQPYIFPYIGYFQLISAVDKFVFYDDVTFIKQGWINRNRILANGRPHLFSIPLSGASSHALIRDVRINQTEYPVWRAKFIKTLHQYYCKAPQYKFVISLILDVLDCSPALLATTVISSIRSVCKFLDISTDIVESSSIYGNSHLKSQDRILDICHYEKASVYINAIGGAELYSKQLFRSQNIELCFLKPNDIIYAQLKKQPFVPWLSIIDVLMFNSPENARQLISCYELV